MLRRLLLLLTLLLAAPAAAQVSTHIVPELTAEGPVAPGGSVDLALVMHTEQGWHGYWRNPGDAGLPMRIKWDLPAGVALGALRYPVPDRLTIAGLMNYVFERDHAILLRLTAPANATDVLHLSGEAEWLACTDEICVPERGRIAFDVPVGKGPAQRARFDEFRRALPRPLAAPAHFAVEGNRIDLAMALPRSVAIGELYWFPGDRGVVDYAAPQTFRRNGNWLIGSLPRAKGGSVPNKIEGVLALGDGRGLEVVATPGTVPAGGTPVGGSAVGLWWALLGALAGGLLLNLMPCVFPILALKAMHLARAGGDERAARREALGYALGAIVGTGLLGVLLLALRASGSAAGWAFQLQDPRTILLLFLLASAITLNLLRLFELPVLAGERTPLGSVGTGLLAAFVATPCSGPFLGVALGAALLLPPLASVAIFAALGLGLALPFVLLSFVPALRNRMPRPGPWMVRFQRFLALPMAASAAACLWLLHRQSGSSAVAVALGALLLLAIVLLWLGRRQRQGASIGPAALLAVLAVTIGAMILVPAQTSRAARMPLGQQAWSEAALASARASGKSTFVYFTADWCLTCKANEAGAIEREAVRAAFAKAGVTVLVGDWTNGNPAITRFLDSRGRAGVPLYLWYPAGGGEPEELPQILTPSMLISRAGS